jgi:hypothetical protein
MVWINRCGILEGVTHLFEYGLEKYFTIAYRMGIERTEVYIFLSHRIWNNDAFSPEYICPVPNR